MAHDRIEQVDSLLRQELTTFLARHAEWPVDTFTTVEEVRVSRDLAHAIVMISVFPAEHRKAVFLSLDSMKHDLHQYLRGRLDFKIIPKIFFRFDEREQRADHINRLLDERTDM